MVPRKPQRSSIDFRIRPKLKPDHTVPPFLPKFLVYSVFKTFRVATILYDSNTAEAFQKAIDAVLSIVWIFVDATKSKG